MNGRTSQAAVEMVGNRFDLILISSLRARELRAGYPSKLAKTNGPIVTALNEIEQGLVGREYLKKIKGKKKYGRED
jgi:DNA-directed RNA polymerase subunit omega